MVACEMEQLHSTGVRSACRNLQPNRRRVLATFCDYKCVAMLRQDPEHPANQDLENNMGTLYRFRRDQVYRIHTNKKMRGVVSCHLRFRRDQVHRIHKQKKKRAVASCHLRRRRSSGYTRSARRSWASGSTWPCGYMVAESSGSEPSDTLSRWHRDRCKSSRIPRSLD